MTRQRWPGHGWLGLVLIAAFWPINWALQGMRTHWGFFPLWLGYCLVVDALVVTRKGTSLLTRSRLGFAGLFAASIPSWWLFELINTRTRNWVYLSDPIGDIEYALLASLSFSTVMPAVFGTAELAGTFGWIRRLGPGPRLVPSRKLLVSCFIAGWLMLALLLTWPRYFFPLVWLSVYFILEPVNAWLGNRTLFEFTRHRDWRPVAALWVGCLICGLFWEMWNYRSYPKWTYQVPFVGVFKVFEMPALGYGGYLPFALELYALYHLMLGVFGLRRWQHIRLVPEPGTVAYEPRLRLRRFRCGSEPSQRDPRSTGGADLSRPGAKRDSQPRILPRWGRIIMGGARGLVGLLLLATGFVAGVALTCRADPQDHLADVAKPREVTPRASLTPEELGVTTLFEEVSPSVVYVTSLAVRRDFFRLNVFEIPQGTGSGFVWDNHGHIVTNFHVIQGGERFEVTLADRSSWPATPVGGAPEKDLAVLRIEAPPDTLRPIHIGTSHDLKVGQTVLAIGNPFGFDQTLTTGIISALGREIESLSRVPISDVIQTDAAINPGNSGGPLLDSVGRLIGVNTAIVSPSGGYAGIGFAIPVDTVNWVVPDLIAYGAIRRPTLGIELAPSSVNRQLQGVLVLNVVEGSGADAAGLRPTRRDRGGRVVLGDIIVAIDGQPVRSPEELRLRLEQRRAGDTVAVTVDRDGTKRDLRIRLGEPN